MKHVKRRASGHKGRREDSGETLFTGAVVDQVALHGLLKKVRDVGMHLLSDKRVTPGQADTSDVNEKHH